MKFNLNSSVVKMLEVLAKHPSLQWFVIALIAVWRLPETITAIAELVKQ